MAAYYLDSSALAKRYIVEPGTAWMLGLVDPSAGNDLHTVRLTGTEIIAMLARGGRGGRLSSADAAVAIADFRADWSTFRYTIIDADREVLDFSMDIAESHGLRGYDAVHLAAAILVQQQRQAEGLPGLVFISADQEQLRAAAAEGLLTDDPNLHI